MGLSSWNAKIRFYSILHHGMEPMHHWTGNFIGGAPGNPLFAYMF